MSQLFRATIISNGQEVSITDGAPFAILQEEGLMMSPLQRVIERAPQQHGDTDLGYWLQTRLINLVIGIYEDTADDLWAAREQLISLLAPYYSPVLEIGLSNGNARRLDVRLDGTMNAGSTERHGLSQRVGFALRAADPSFYDPTAVSVTFSLGGGSDAFVVPTPVPTGIGASTINQSTTINYTGTWRSHPQIRFIGPITDAVMVNEAIDEKLDFTGTTISGGDYYDIDTRYGQKSVVDSLGVNKISALTSDSDLGTFHLSPATPANSIRVTGSGVTDATQVIITYYLRYLGI